MPAPRTLEVAGLMAQEAGLLACSGPLRLPTYLFKNQGSGIFAGAFTERSSQLRDSLRFTRSSLLMLVYSNLCDHNPMGHWTAQRY